MAITITGPDGASIDFPEGTSEAEMQAAMAQAYPEPPSVPQPGVMAGVSRALETNLPFVDRAVAAAKSALPQGYGGAGQDYATNLAAEKAKNAQFAEQNPWTTAVGGLTAYAPAALLPAGGASLLGRIGVGAATGFGLGGLQGLSNSPDLTDNPATSRDIAQEATSGAALGGIGVPIAHAIGSGVSALASGLRGGPGPADLAALDKSVGAAYKQVKDIGAAYSPASIKTMTDQIAADAAEADIDPDLNPKATKIINNLQARAAAKVDSGEPVTLPELDKWRQFVNDNLSGLPEPKQARFGALIRKNIDDLVNTAFPGDMVPMPTAKAPGAAAKEESATPARPQVPPSSAPTPMLDFLRNHGGLQDEGGDLKSMGFSNLRGVASKGSSKIIDKENGVPMDEGRRLAVEAGYMEPHETVPDFINKLGEHPTYSVHDQEAVAAREARDAYDYGPQEAERAPEDFAGLGSEPEAIGQVPTPAPNTAVLPPVANAREAAAAIRNARDLAMRQFKAKALTAALSKAEDRADVAGTGGNIENTTRQKLLIARDKEPWSQDELAQINTMIHGTPVTNTLRQFSRFGPRGNALMAALELGALGTGNPTLMGAGVAGLGAQAASALMRRNAQNKLMATILAGGKAPSQAASSSPVSRAAMAAALAANAGPQTPRSQAPQQ